MLFEIISLICCFYLLFPLGCAITAAFTSSRVLPKEDAVNKSDFACVITVYKELDIAWPLVKSLLKQHYPHFHVYMVVDAAEGDAFNEIKDERLTVLKPPRALNSKVASLAFALENMDIHHTHVTVFDPDNLVPPHFLTVLDHYHAAGYQAVQGKRIAKNIDGTYEALDALGEYYYDYTVRNVPFRLGSSSTIAGSGMSIEKDIYAENIGEELRALEKKGVVVAEDKSLQLQLVKSGYRIAYAPAAIVFDEKISSHGQIGKQRGRWLNSYFGHSLKALEAFFRGVFSLDWNLVLFSVAILMPPMVVLVGLTLLLVVLSIILQSPYVFLLTGCLVVFTLTFVLVLLLNRTPLKVIAAMVKIPFFVWGQLYGFLNIRRANKDFMATTHQQKMEIDEVWTKRQGEFYYLRKWW
ncbi:glycosyltransferase [Negadavirga shengliensis]|uniref:Glycosyltransferase n=1 Tax=Negadavirga shengliensis TaxID=1389218 RepID=A0ABV9T4B2_9BACT